jgi:hypothetical protein
MFMVEVTYPGTMLQMDDPQSANRVGRVLDLLVEKLADAAIALSMFATEFNRTLEDPGRAWESRMELRRQLHRELAESDGGEALNRNVHGYDLTIEREVRRRTAASGKVPDAFAVRIVFMHAHSFLYAVDSFGKVLSVLSKEPGVPTRLAEIAAQHQYLFDVVREVRNSALHIEDRGRGLNRKRKPLDLQPIVNNMIHAPRGNLLVSGNLNGTRLGYTVDDGTFLEIDVSPATLTALVEISQEVVDSFEWKGPPQLRP